jgi:hypothetical protein
MNQIQLIKYLFIINLLYVKNEPGSTTHIIVVIT